MTEIPVVDIESLKQQFHLAMLDLYRKIVDETKSKYKPTEFLSLVGSKGGLATVQDLVNASTESYGYTRLYELNRLDLTVEAQILKDKKWYPLFTDDERKRARERLEKYRFKI